MLLIGHSEDPMSWSVWLWGSSATLGSNPSAEGPTGAEITSGGVFPFLRNLCRTLIDTFFDAIKVLTAGADFPPLSYFRSRKTTESGKT